MAAHSIGHTQSAEEKYQVWKEDTLARQTGHIEAVQSTGMLQQFPQKGLVNKGKDSNNYLIEVSPGYR